MLVAEPQSLVSYHLARLRAAGVVFSRRSTADGRDTYYVIDLDEFAGTRFAYVVSLCDRVREICPAFPDHPDVIHWSVADPSREGTYPAFRRTLREIETRVGYLLELIGAGIEAAP